MSKFAGQGNMMPDVPRWSTITSTNVDRFVPPGTSNHRNVRWSHNSGTVTTTCH